MDASDDGVLHSMLFHSDTELAFAVVYNTCYGWGNLYCTNSSSAFQAKEFWAFFLDMENKSGDYGNWELGRAHAYSKDRMAPTIGWDYYYGTWRAIIQGCLLFGDPAQRIKTPHPSEPPYSPEAPEGPEEGIIDVYYDFTAITTDPEEEQIYYLFDWGDGHYSDWIGPFPSGQTGEASHNWSDLGDYEIRVKAKDIWGAVSDWSESFIFSIVINTPPENPTVDGPSWGFAGREYEFTFSADDYNGHDLYYYISWDDGSNTGWFGPYAPGEQVTESHTWQEKGTYIVKFRAMDQIGDRSGQTNHKLELPIKNFDNQQLNTMPLFQNLLNSVKNLNIV
jgi:hypothetical protein